MNLYENDSVTLLQITDKVNHDSNKMAVESFKKIYKEDGKVILLNTQHCKEIDEFGESQNFTVIRPQKKLPYPLFRLDQPQELWDWCDELMYKPIMMVDTEYVVWGEPDCFFNKKTNFHHFNDVDIISCLPRHGSWWFGSIDIRTNDGSSTVGKILNDLKILLKKLNLTENMFLDHIEMVFGIGSFIKTKRIQKLLVDQKQTIKQFHFEYLKILDFHYKTDAKDPNHVFYMFPDQFISFILLAFDFKKKYNPNYGSPVDEFNDDPLDSKLNDFEILHPVKKYYFDKKQAWGYYAAQ